MSARCETTQHEGAEPSRGKRRLTLPTGALFAAVCLVTSNHVHQSSDFDPCRASGPEGRCLRPRPTQRRLLRLRRAPQFMKGR